MLIRAFMAWIPMVFIAIINGAIRQLVYGPKMSELYAHQISTITGIAFMSVYIFFIQKFLKIKTTRIAIMTGVYWVLLTIAFEFTFGHFVAGKSFDLLLRDYNLLEGRAWILFLLWILITPYLLYKVQNKN